MATQTDYLLGSDGSASPLSSAPPDVGSEDDWEDVEEDVNMADATEEDASDTTNAEVTVTSNDVQNKNKTFHEKIEQATAQAKASTSSPSKKRPAQDPLPTAPPTAAPKHPFKPDRNAEAALEVQKLPYQSIISLNMPPRMGLRPGHPIPAPIAGEYPFGNTEDHNNSYIIHLMDEQQLTYTKAAEVYSKKFPHDIITDEAVRKRHIRSLLRLKKRFGEKKEEQIETAGISRNVKRRGTPRAKKWHTIPRVSTPSYHVDDIPPTGNKRASPNPEPGIEAQQRPRAKKRKLLNRDFEKTCIVIWRDTLNMSFKQVREKLENEMHWSLGLQTIEKYYYLAGEKVYGAGGRKAWEGKEIADGGGEEERKALGKGVEGRFVERRMSV